MKAALPLPKRLVTASYHVVIQTPGVCIYKLVILEERESRESTICRLRLIYHITWQLRWRADQSPYAVVWGSPLGNWSGHRRYKHHGRNVPAQPSGGQTHPPGSGRTKMIIETFIHRACSRKLLYSAFKIAHSSHSQNDITTHGFNNKR